MKKKFNYSSIKANKHKYLFLIVLVIIGIISGIIFSNIITYNDQMIVNEKMTEYFNNIKENTQINYWGNFFNSLNVNFFYMLCIWIFGLSIIGIIINIFILFFKSFILGFTIGSFIMVYGYKGILGLSLYSLHHLLNIIIYILLTYYAINFSYKLFKSLFLKKQIKFTGIMQKYIRILVFSSIILLISSIYETFLLNFILKIFTFFLK